MPSSTRKGSTIRYFAAIRMAHVGAALALALPALGVFGGCGDSETASQGPEHDATPGGDGATTDSAPPVDGSIQDSGIDVRSIDPLAGIGSVQAVGGGHAFSEGPLWLANDGVLLFSDIPDNEIMKYDPAGGITVFRMNSAGSNGLALDPMGRLIACEGQGRRVARRKTDGSYETVIDSWMTNKLNAPNDAIVHSNGSIYFTDPDYGLAAQDKELGFNGVFRVDANGVPSLIADDLNKPNGIALSPDERSLYVTDAAAGFVRRYQLDAAGVPSAPSKLFDTENPDGMTVDDAGNLYVAAKSGVEVYREDGSVRGTIAVPEQPANCAFGGSDRKTLFITARTTLYSIALNVPGPP